MIPPPAAAAEDRKFAAPAAAFPQAALHRPHESPSPSIPYPTALDLDAIRDALVDAGWLNLPELRDLVRMVAAATGATGHVSATLTLRDAGGEAVFAVTADAATV